MYLLVLLIAVVVFVYMAWKELHDDLGSQKVIGFVWLLVLVLILSGRAFGGGWSASSPWSILMIWKPMAMNYLVALIVGIIVCALVARKENWKLWSVLEDITTGFLVFQMILYIADILGGFSYDLLIRTGIVLLAAIWSVKLKKKYRSIVWYKSGKKGFVFFAVSTIVLLLMAVSAFCLKNGTYMPYLYLGASLISGLGLYMLGKL